MTEKALVYVVGCGRSGSTILGYALGNMDRAVDLGEVIDFVKYQGQPNGFGPGTDTYLFWDGIRTRLEHRLGRELDFPRLARLQSRVDTHAALLTSWISGWRAAERIEWRQFLQAFYDTLLEDERFDVYIDSSKYPSRLWHLHFLYGSTHLRIVHLIRDPVDLALSYRWGDQSRTRGFVPCMVYYLFVNLVSCGLIRGFRSSRATRLFFEDFLASSEGEVARIGRSLNLDVGRAVELIAARAPLRRGFVFNGNRVRMQESIVLEARRARPQVVPLYQRWFGDWILRIFRGGFASPRG